MSLGSPGEDEVVEPPGAAHPVLRALPDDPSVPRSRDQDWAALGRTIRSIRLAQGLTMTGLAQKIGLSQPFLSQVENGRARPSLGSLHRIADGLGVTPQQFFPGSLDPNEAPLVVRSAEVHAVEVVTTDEAVATGAPLCRVVLGGRSPLHVLEFDGVVSEFQDYFTHDGVEVAYVVTGRVEVDLDGECTILEAGDSISYPATIPHRMRGLTPRRRSKMLLIGSRDR